MPGTESHPSRNQRVFFSAIKILPTFMLKGNSTETQAFQTTYTNITSTFSGIGHILLDVNSIVISAVEQYDLDLKTVPSQTIYLHFQYIVQNLKRFQLRDILFHYEFTGDPYFDLVLSILDDGSFHSYTSVRETLDNKRVALVLSCFKRDALNRFFLSSGLYVGMMDLLVFEIPFALAIVSKPVDAICPDLEYDFVPVSYSRDGMHETAVDTKRMNLEFFASDQEYCFEKSKTPVEEALVLSLLKASLFGPKIFFDGRIFMNLRKPAAGDGSADRTLFDVAVPEKWSGKDLDLIMPPIPERISLKHLANIRKSAMSLYDGRFHYSSIVKESSERPKKQSAKVLKIIRENEARIERERERADNVWLKNFYANYSRMSSLKGKRQLLENMRVSNEYIGRRLLLLKIELYSDIWSLEKRGEDVDERVLVPLYLSCLDYVENYVNDGNFDMGELEFVLTKLVEGGFEATTRELLERLSIEMELPFTTNATSAPNDADLYIQLKYAGDHLKRTLGTRKDKRVPFDPDEWQVQLLDAVDSNKSAIVAAPTSSGKTFICFYAIEKVLRSSDTDVVVFCLPTKALVNQVSADVYARFNPKNTRTSLQGTLMSDKSNDPFNCQVLITVPSMLESLLNSRDCSNIRYIIIDEVHKINDSSLGLRMERIIHLARCPLLLLSATLGNLEKFYEWFRNVERSKGRDCELVVHTERYCELKLHVYTESKGGDKNSEGKGACAVGKPGLTPLNSMFAYSFSHLKSFGFGNDLHFLPEELLNIYYYIYMVLEPPQKKLIKSLAPKKFFKSNIICKADIKKYQEHLLSTFESWIQQSILSEAQVEEVHNLLTGEAHSSFTADSSEKYLTDNILKLLNTLKDSDMLPVIVFNTDREFVTRLAKAVYQELENSDIQKKRDKILEKMKKEAKRTRDVEKTRDSWIEDSIASEQSIEPEQRDIRYTFLDPITKLTDYDIKEEFSDIRGFPKEIMDMAYRGIGVHHSALSRKYRSAVEILFRKKHVRVLFATETLALGINMPCRTVVFAGDSLQLDPMNYKQMSGRAGRRGYDTLGNVVFFGIPKHRVQNLMVSMLPEIQGAYTFSNTSLVAFDIEESILRNPLLSASGGGAEDIGARLKSMRIPGDVPAVRCTVDTLDSLGSRKELVEHQKKIYPHIFPPNYLWDLQICNRDFDPSIFVFSLLFQSNAISWTPNDFMGTVAHLFEVRPVHSTFEYSLGPLPRITESAVDTINEIYVSDLRSMYSPELKTLQRMSRKPLHLIKSFIYTHQESKNSYIYDFYQHGSSVKIGKYNLVGEGELWQSLYNIDVFLKSLVTLLETYHGASDDRLKKLRVIHEEFSRKFNLIFA